MKMFTFINNPFKGRVGRLGLVLGVATNTLLAGVTIFGYITFANWVYQYSQATILGILSIIIFVFLNIGFMIISLTFYIRRLHDIDRSGWWTMLLFVPIVNFLFIFYLLIKSGTRGENKYGSPVVINKKDFLAFLISLVLFLITVPLFTHLDINKGNKTRHQAIIYLKDQATEQERNLFIRELEQLKGVRDVTYTSKEQAFEIYKEHTKDNPTLSQYLSPNILPASIEVFYVDISVKSKIDNLVKTKNFVESVNYVGK